MKHANSVLDVVGHTPLVNLNRVTDAVQATVLAKAEYLNPRGVGPNQYANPNECRRRGARRHGRRIVRNDQAARPGRRPARRRVEWHGGGRSAEGSALAQDAIVIVLLPDGVLSAKTGALPDLPRYASD